MKFSLRNNAARLMRYGATGIVNTFVDFAVFGLLVTLASAPPFYANLLAFAAAVVCSFFLNRNWTFADRAEAKRPSHRRTTQLVIFVLCMSATALFSSWLLTQLLALGLALPLAKIAVTIISMLVNYLLMNRVIFRPEQSPKSLDRAAATRRQ